MTDTAEPTSAAPAPAAPAGPPSAPGQMTPEAAREEIAIRKADPAFVKEYTGGQFQAVQKMRQLHAIGYPEGQYAFDATGKQLAPVTQQQQQSPSDRARSRIDELRQDPQFSQRLGANESKAVMEWRVLHRQAYPELSTMPKEPQTIPEIREQLQSGETPGDPINPDNGHPMSYQPGKAEDFDLRALVAEPGKDPDPAALALAKTTQGWLATAGMPAQVGVAVAREGNDFAARWLQASPEQRNEMRAQGKQQLERLWKENYRENMATTLDMMNQIGERHPEIYRFFNENGLGNSPMLLNLLHQHARRLERAADRRAKK